MAGKGAAFELSVLLKVAGGGRAGQGVSRFASQLRAANKDARTLLRTVNQLNSRLEVRANTSGLDQMTRQMRAFRTEARGVARDAQRARDGIREGMGRGGARDAFRNPTRPRRSIDDELDHIGRLDRNGGREPQPRGREARAAARANSELHDTVRRQPHAPQITSSRRPRRSVEDELDYIGRLGRGERTERQPRGRAGRFFGRAEGLDDAFDTGRQIGHVWRERADALSQYTDEAMRLSRAQMQLRIIGLPEDQNRRGLEAVRQTVNQIRGTSLTDTTQSLTDMVGALGDMDQAIRALPLASRYRLGFQTLFGDQFGPEQLQEQTRDAFKFLELTGNTQRGPAQMEQMLDTITRIQASTGGRVTPTDMLLMARRGRAAVQGLSPQGLRNISSLTEEMGPEQVGTALMSMYQSLVAGTMRQSSAERFRQLGLLDPSRIEFGRAQQIRRLRPGANLLGPLMQEDPLKAADLLMERLRGAGVDTTDDRAVQRELSVLFQNRTAFGLMNMLTTQRPQVVREAGRAETSLGLTGINQLLQDSDLLKVREFEAAWKNMRAEVGIPLLRSGTEILRGLQPLFDIASSHPRIVMGFMAIRHGIVPLIETVSLFSRGVDMFSGFTRGANAASSAVDGLHGKASRLAGLKPIVLTAQFMVAGIAIDQIIGWWNEIEERNRNTAQSNLGVRENYDQMVGRGELFGGRNASSVSTEQLDTLARQAHESFKMGRALELALQPERSGLFENFWTAQRPYSSRWSFQPYEGVRNAIDPSYRGYDPERAAGVMRQQQGAVALQDPRVLSRLILQNLRGETGYDARGRELYQQTLQRVAPNEFPEAMRLANAEIAALAQQSQATGQALDLLQQPANSIPAAFLNVGTAANNLTNRFNALAFTPPTFNLNFNRSLNPPSLNLGQPPPTFNFGIPSREIGGFVRRGGVAAIHTGEAIVPADVTRGLTVNETFNARGSGSNATPVNITYAPQITTTGGKADHGEFRRQLQAHSREIESLVMNALQGGRERS